MAARDSELRELAFALDASRRTTAFLELLNRVAVPSNEASTVEEAMQTSLDEVCRLTGWPVGHVYMPDPDDPNGWVEDAPTGGASFRVYLPAIRQAERRTPTASTRTQ